MADSGGANGGDTCNFFRKSPRNRNIRKRKSAASSFDKDDATPSIPKPKKIATSKNKFHFSSACPSALDAPNVASSNPDPTLFRYASSAEIQVNHDSRTIVTLETPIHEHILKCVEEALKGKPNAGGAAASSSNVCRGINSYTNYKADFTRTDSGRQEV